MPDTYKLTTDDAGNPVVEIVRVERLDLRRARQTLVVMGMTLKQGRDRLDVIAAQYTHLKELLASVPPPQVPVPGKEKAP